jgi:hypothetical protein
LLLEAYYRLGVLFDPLVAFSHHRIGKAFGDIVEILLCSVSQFAEDLQRLRVSLVLVIYVRNDISSLFEEVQLSALKSYQIDVV